MTKRNRLIAGRRAALALVGILCIGAIWLDFVQPSENEYQLYSFTFALPSAEIAATNLNWISESNIPVADESRPVLFAHPDAAITYRNLSIPKNARLRAAFGVNQDAWDRDGDGVEFSVDLTSRDGATTRLFSQYIDPKNNPADRHWFDMEVDLGQWEGQSVDITWNTNGGPQGIGSDWAGWNNPRLVQVERDPPWWITTLIKLLLVLPLLAFAPGYLLMTRFGPANRLQFSEALYLVIVISLLTTSVFALALAQAGQFSLWALVLSEGTGTLILYLMTACRPKRTLPHPRWRTRTLPSLFLFVIAAILFFHPSERIIGGQDPGVYLSTGVNLARTGSILITDPIISPLFGTEYARNLTAPMGFYPNDNGILTPHGVHLQPTWIAILYSIGKLRLALVTNALFAWLGVMALYLIGRRLWGEEVAFTAGLLLTVNIGEIWFARWYVAEMLVQFLFFAGLLAMLIWQDRQHRGPGNMLLASVAAASIGLIHLTKLDSFLLLFVVALWLIWRWYRGPWRSDHWAFTSIYLAFIGYTVLHAALFSTEYVKSLFSFYLHFLEWEYSTLVMAVAAISSVPLLLLSRRPGHWIAVKLGRLQKPILWLLTLLIAGSAIYGFFIRPERVFWDNSEWPALQRWATEPDGLFGNQPDSPNFMRSFVEESLVRLSWYVTPLGFFLACGGLVALLWSRERSRTFLLWGGVLIQTVFFASKGTIFPQHFWAIRRHVQLIIPAIMLLISFFLWRVAVSKSARLFRLQPAWRVVFQILIVGTASGLALVYWSTADDYALATDFDGGVQQLDGLAHILPKDALIMMGDEGTAHQVGTPLNFIFDRKTVVSTPQRVTDVGGNLAELISMWRSEGYAVLWLTSVKDRQIAPWSRYENIPLTIYQMNINGIATDVDGLPTEIIPFSPTFYLYELRPAEEGQGSQTFDIGNAGDEPFIANGFYQPENDLQRTFRWTDGDALVTLPLPPNGEHWIASFTAIPTRPEGFSQPVELTVYANSHILGTVVLGPDVNTVEFPIDTFLAETTETIEFELVSDTWIPADWSDSSDVRALGVQLDRIIVRQDVSLYN